MLFTCRACRYTFPALRQPASCPDCGNRGKNGIYPATAAEIEHYNKVQSEIAAEEALLATPVDELGLPVPARSGLAGKGIFTVRDIVALKTGSALLSIPGIGKITYTKIVRRLFAAGLSVDHLCEKIPRNTVLKWIR